MFIFFLIKGNQTTLPTFMITDPAAPMGIWPCSASLRIHPLVRAVFHSQSQMGLILFRGSAANQRCDRQRCGDKIIAVVLKLVLITVIPFGL